MTERLYYRDSFLREFEARVVGCEAAGKQFRVVLDRTAFYPTSGGQPYDTGTLGSAKVQEVIDAGERIVHVTDRGLPLEGVQGAVDWERRFDHMQQHTGQHLLSAAFIELFHFPTVSFHLGREISTIDLDARAVEAVHLEEAEALTNRIIFEDRPVSVRFATAAELAHLGVRKEVNRSGELRVIEVENFDRQPCGGTHVARSGQVGALLLRKCEKQKQYWRVEFVCGQRAIRTARSDFVALGQAARILTCGPSEVPALIAKWNDERQESHRARQRVLEQLAGYEARALLTPERVTGAGRTEVERSPSVIVRILDEADAAYLRLLASKVVAEARVQVLLGSQSTGDVVFAQAPGMSADLSRVLREALAGTGGKGGGTPDCAQGRVAEVSRLDECLSRAAAALQP